MLSGSIGDASGEMGKREQCWKNSVRRWKDWDVAMISLTSPIETPYHGLPAGQKLLVLCAFTFAIFLTSRLDAHLAAVAFVSGVHLGAGIRFTLLAARRLLPVWPFLAVVILWHIATDDLVGGTVISIRLVATIGLANLVTMTTRLDDLADVFKTLLVPFERIGIRLDGLEMAIALVLRFTPLLLQRGTMLVEAWKSRSRRHPSWRIVFPLTLLAIDDAERVSEALQARCRAEREGRSWHVS